VLEIFGISHRLISFVFLAYGLRLPPLEQFPVLVSLSASVRQYWIGVASLHMYYYIVVKFYMPSGSNSCVLVIPVS